MRVLFFLTFLLSATVFAQEQTCLSDPHQFEFGCLWNHVKGLEQQQLLYPMIQKRRQEIARIKEHWKSILPSLQEATLVSEVSQLMRSGTLLPAPSGYGAAYFLYDSHQTPRYVIKPFDEEMFCLNNRKEHASPYHNHAFRVRAAIPLYTSAQTELLAARFAERLGLAHLIPPTSLAILSHPQFYDVGDKLSAEEKVKFYVLVGGPDREKLCSVQRYLPHLRSLYSLVQEWLAASLDEAHILAQIEQAHFEELTLLIWLLYDTDAHASNVYVQKSHDGTYRLFKFDNGLTFPEKNERLLNALAYLPHARRPLSAPLREKIAHLPIDLLVAEMSSLEMEHAIDAFLERCSLLQKLTSHPHLTIQEIDLRLQLMFERE